MDVDDFIDSPTTDAYASFVLCLFRLPACLQMKFSEQTKGYRLFCTYQGKRWRVTGASRVGDVWLAKDMNLTAGYDVRVDVAECGEWGAEA